MRYSFVRSLTPLQLLCAAHISVAHVVSLIVCSHITARPVCQLSPVIGVRAAMPRHKWLLRSLLRQRAVGGCTCRYPAWRSYSTRPVSLPDPCRVVRSRTIDASAMAAAGVSSGRTGRGGAYVTHSQLDASAALCVTYRNYSNCLLRHQSHKPVSVEDADAMDSARSPARETTTTTTCAVDTPTGARLRRREEGRVRP